MTCQYKLLSRELLEDKVTFGLISGVALELQDLAPESDSLVIKDIKIDKQNKIYIVELIFEADTHESNIDHFIYDYVSCMRYSHALLLFKNKSSDCWYYEASTYTNSNEGFIIVFHVYVLE